MNSVTLYFMEYQQITMYLLSLVVCIGYCFFFTKGKKQVLTMITITLFFIFSPKIRNLTYSWLELAGYEILDKDFFLFYVVYELIFGAVIVLINIGEDRAFPLYVVACVCVVLNIFCYEYWDSYEHFIYENYQTANRFLLDTTVLLVISMLKNRAVLAVTGVLIITPYLTNKFIFG